MTQPVDSKRWYEHLKDLQKKGTLLFGRTSASARCRDLAGAPVCLHHRESTCVQMAMRVLRCDLQSVNAYCPMRLNECVPILHRGSWS